MSGLRLRPVGDRAILAELPDLDSVHGLVAAARKAASAGELAGAVDIIPGYRTVLVTGLDSAALATALRRLEPVPAEEVAAHEPVEVGVVYDGEDLAEAAELVGMSESELIERHTAGDYRVAFLGFTPGFPYLVGLDPALHVPRRSTPRTTVPAGAVGLAGAQTGIYPRSSPGGWQLIGRTDAVLFDPDRDPPALLAPGDRLRFVARETADLPAVAERPGLAGGDVTVRRPGPLTTVQDLGRTGFASIGVPVSGAADPRSARLANRLVGNVETAAVLEVTLGGLELAFARPAFVAVCGADAPVLLNGAGVGEDNAIRVGAGDLVTVGSARRGLRSYLAVRGGIDVPAVLGSRSTDTLADLGPAPLREGDQLAVGTATNDAEVQHELVPTRSPPDVVELRVVPGPRDDRLTGEGLHQLFATPWTVTSSSDRTGLRLDGPELARSNSEELLSEGIVAGALQVPPNGRPILFLANHPTTGGYPVVGVVASEDLPLAGQAGPGTVLRFRRIAPPAL
ncbi:MAG TPA: 5-oxoprolinase subunit PxpB [Frankiaceae bacterium]|nr:5-oxoprolinase subunit PxpB [Frankiaceae bacterium]